MDMCELFLDIKYFEEMYLSTKGELLKDVSVIFYNCVLEKYKMRLKSDNKSELKSVINNLRKLLYDSKVELNKDGYIYRTYLNNKDMSKEDLFKFLEEIVMKFKIIKLNNSFDYKKYTIKIGMISEDKRYINIIDNKLDRYIAYGEEGILLLYNKGN